MCALGNGTGTLLPSTGVGNPAALMLFQLEAGGCGAADCADTPRPWGQLGQAAGWVAMETKLSAALE